MNPPADPIIPPRRALRMLALLLLAAANAQAAEVCVDTSLELRAALDRFIEDGEDMVINIAQGEYSILSSIRESGADLTLRGGFTDGGCSARSYDPALTVLRLALAEILDVEAGNLAIGSITFEEIENHALLRAAGGVFGNGVLEMTRVRFVDPSAGGLKLWGDEVYVTQAVLSRQGSANNGCALEFIGSDSGDIVSIQHTTVADNPNFGVCINRNFLAPQDDGYRVRIDNNVFYDNALSLTIDDTSDYLIRNNVVDGFLADFGAADPGASGNNIPDDPLFVNAGAQDFRLGNSSPAINAGGTTTFGGLPQFDVVGNPRFVGPRPDMGAYESSDSGSGELLTVTNTSDGVGVGSLRWALNQANAHPNFSSIIFNIPGACPHIISPGSELPKILTRIAILGYSQPGSSSNTGVGVGGGTNANLCIHLAGQTSRNYGLHIPLAAGSSGWLNLSGIAFSGFQQAAIALEAGIGSIVTGNRVIGGAGVGILVAGSAEDSQIGGPDPWQRNLIQGSSYGVALNPFGDGNVVENNLIGLSADGNAATASTGNDIGIGISGNGNFVRNNAIAGNGAGVHVLDGDRNYVTANTFGMKVGFFICPIGGSCPRDLFNDSHGVLIQGSAFDNGIWSNLIANSGGAGIRLTDTGQRNSFSGNRIWNSGEFGIDLNGFGRQIPNNDADPGEAATANRGLNHPTVATARGGHYSGVATGALVTTNGNYRIEAYASDSCTGDRGQARWSLGGTNVTIANAPAGNNGSAVYTIDLRAPNFVALDNYYITVAATDAQGAIGMGNTSELSSCRQYVFDDVIFADDFES